MFRSFRLKNYNFKLVINALILSFIGIMCIYIANPAYFPKQIMGVVLGLFLMALVSVIDFQFFTRNSEILYVANILLLLFVKFFGKSTTGAQRWISLGPFGTLQVSEFSKIIMILVIATFLVKHEYDFNEPRELGKLALICAPPMYLILSQPDLSTTLAIFFVVLVMLFYAGIDSKLIVRVVAIGVPVGALFLWYVQTPGQVLLRPHQVARIMSFLHPEDYANSTALQTNNSIMAIGSGGLFGKGLFGGSSAGVSASDVNLVSEQQTDFIFSVVGERLGFVGCVILIVVLFLLFFQCVQVARKTESLSGTLVAMGVAAYFGIQSFVNIGVATGTIPNTGLPLPFISYGLSSLMASFIAIGLILNIHLQIKRY